jgi:hypothetical protein
MVVFEYSSDTWNFKQNHSLFKHGTSVLVTGGTYLGHTGVFLRQAGEMSMTLRLDEQASNGFIQVTIRYYNIMPDPDRRIHRLFATGLEFLKDDILSEVCGLRSIAEIDKFLRVHERMIELLENTVQEGIEDRI